MGFFEKAGRKVEKFKQTATEAADDHTVECPACEASVPADAETCPDCGAEFTATD